MVTRVVFKLIYRPGRTTNVDSMTINRISMGRMALIFSFYFIFNTCWPKCTADYWSVSNSFNWNIQSLAKYHKIKYTGICGNNMARFIYHIYYIDIKVGIEWKRKCPSSYWYSINGHGVVNICLAPGPSTNLNSTCGLLISTSLPQISLDLCNLCFTINVFHSL